METGRDRSWFALIEVALSIALIVTWWLPWYVITPSTPDGIPTGPAYSVGINGVDSGGVTDAQLIVLLGPPLLLMLTVLAAALPWRGFVVGSLVAFLATGCVGAVGLIRMANFDLLGYWPTRPDVGLQLFAWLCLAGTLITAVDLTRGGSATALWRHLRSPSIRRFGPFVGYALVVVISLLVALFPMSARWTWLVFVVLLVGLVWWARALRTN